MHPEEFLNFLSQCVFEASGLHASFAHTLVALVTVGLGSILTTAVEGSYSAPGRETVDRDVRRRRGSSRPGLILQVGQRLDLPIVAHRQSHGESDSVTVPCTDRPRKRFGSCHSPQRAWWPPVSPVRILVVVAALCTTPTHDPEPRPSVRRSRHDQFMTAGWSLRRRLLRR